MADVVRPDFISGGKLEVGNGKWEGKIGAAQKPSVWTCTHCNLQLVRRVGFQDPFPWSLLRSFGGKPPCHPPGRTSSIWALHRPLAPCLLPLCPSALHRAIKQ